MAKKSSSGTSYVSKGIHSTVAKSTLNGMKADRSESENVLNRQSAYLKGSNPWVTIENPNKTETKCRFIKVRMNDLMHGSAKDREKKMFIMK
jgi:hypothetical protein